MRRFLTSCMIIILTLTISTGPGLAEVSSPNYWANWFSIHPETKAVPGAQVTAVWANTAHLDLFMTGSDGVVRSTWWEAAPGWQPWFSIHSEVKATPGAPVTAVWSNATHLDLFMTGSDGTVWSTWWEAAPGWHAWFSIHSEVKAAPGTRVTAVWASSTHLDLFMSGSDGTVWSTWWEASTGYHTWFSIRPEVKAKPGAPITAVWASATHLDLFMTDSLGTVWSTWWEAAAGYHTWFSIHPEVKANQGAGVTAVWSTSTHLDLFMTGSDGTVWSTWWEASPGYHTWFSIHPEIKMAPGAMVSALWSNPNHLDLFSTASNGAVYTTWWEATPGWQSWGSIPPGNPAAPGAPVTAHWSNPSHLDLFITGPDGTVYSTYFDTADSPKWGLLANPGFDGNIVKTVYFFAGDWRHSNLPQFYEYQPTPNDSLYTIHPSDARNLGWSESTANQAYTVDQMVNAGTNVVTMSFWGQRGLDRWAFWAPMQTSTYAHDELFNTAISRNILIMPAIESGNATTCYGGNSPAFEFASDFPGTQTNPSPMLVTQIEDLVTRYITAPANTNWPSKWAQIYDRNGIKRYAINILHVASNQVAASDNITFASGFDWVANKVYQDKHVLVGFTLDLLPVHTSVPKGDCTQTRIADTYTANAATTGPYLRLSSSILAVQDFIPEIFSSATSDTDLEAVKASYQQLWKSAGIPVYLDVDPGYDAHIVFPGSKAWGNNAAWRLALSKLRTVDIKGIAYNTWNGYTEGYAAVPTTENGNVDYQWLTELFKGIMPSLQNLAQSIHVLPRQQAVLKATITSGDSPLSFQWFQGFSGQTGVPISDGISDTFTTPPVTQTLHYWVRVSNMAGSIDSPTFTVSTYIPKFFTYLPYTTK